MTQIVTITLDGVDDRVLPDSLGEVLRAVFALLKSMDVRGWNVGTARVRWRVSEAKLVNPLTIAATAESVNPGLDPPQDLAVGLMDRLQNITVGKRPLDFTENDLKLAKAIGVEARRSRTLVLTGAMNGRLDVFPVPRKFAAQVAIVMRQPKHVFTEYGSLDGTLVGLVNDPLKTDGSARLRDRENGVDVSCHASPAMASKMAQYVNRETRVIVYGNITYEDGIPRRVAVEDFITAPAEHVLPTLEDLHALRLRPPNGVSVEEFLDELRGDD